MTPARGRPQCSPRPLLMGEEGLRRFFEERGVRSLRECGVADAEALEALVRFFD